MIADWRLGGEPKKRKLPAQLPGGEAGEEKEVLDAGTGIVCFPRLGEGRRGPLVPPHRQRRRFRSTPPTLRSRPKSGAPASRRSAPTNPPASGTGRSSRSRATACRSN